MYVLYSSGDFFCNINGHKNLIRFELLQKFQHLMGTINIFLTDLRTFRSNFGMTGGFAVFEHFFYETHQGAKDV